MLWQLSGFRNAVPKQLSGTFPNDVVFVPLTCYIITRGLVKHYFKYQEYVDRVLYSVESRICVITNWLLTSVFLQMVVIQSSNVLFCVSTLRLCTGPIENVETCGSSMKLTMQLIKPCIGFLHRCHFLLGAVRNVALACFQHLTWNLLLN